MRLCLGKKEIEAMEDTWDYEGEIDEDGLACGFGVADTGDGWTYVGTFFNDKFEGIGE